ncbi:hypothetical protein MAIC_47480 [Mycolicibacterium aichiense]|uniref:Uncharacterized protein n=1 Tax=Mycolicibacterium aichiense TaxID=1799 RepID=A0AAD1MET0_9MYCO|nr:hypothetical protein MAIC_47480 [Mycolicibacterium aichiense]
MGAGGRIFVGNLSKRVEHRVLDVRVQRCVVVEQLQYDVLDRFLARFPTALLNYGGPTRRVF